MPCCGRAPRRWGVRARTLLTAHGPVPIRREIWHCRQCGTGQAPVDIALALPPGGASWTVREGVALLGAWMPFAKAATVYAHLTGHTVSARSVEHYTEALGHAYTPPVFGPTEPGPTVDTLFVEADATMVWFEDGWHEVKTVVCWGRRAGEDLPPRYLATEGTWEAVGRQIYELARRQGLRLAKQVVCLADGARPIWNVLERWFPQALGLLDWYHLQEHLATVAALLPDGTAWQEQQKTALAERGPTETLRALQGLAVTGQTSAVRETAQACLKYLQGNGHRVNYPQALAAGYPIGSGRVESACGQVVQQRLKQAGMQWAHAHAMAVLAVRCADLNGEWENACHQVRAKLAA